MNRRFCQVLSIGAAAALLSACSGSESRISVLGAMSDSGDVLPYHKTFHFVGRRQSFVVPAGVTSIKVVARGAAGENCTRRIWRRCGVGRTSCGSSLRNG